MMPIEYNDDDMEDSPMMIVKYMVNMMEHDDSQVYGEHDGDLLAEDGVGVEES